MTAIQEKAKTPTQQEINKGIYTTFEKEIKYADTSKAIIKLLSEKYCIAKDFELLQEDLQENKLWKVKKAMNELQKNNYVTAFAIDCEKANNQKDSWKLTNRGTRLAKYLFNLEKTKSSTSARKAQSCCRNRNITETMLQGTLQPNVQYINSEYLGTCLKEDEKAPLRGLYCTGYLLTPETNYLLYSLSDRNIAVYETREKNSLRKIEVLKGTETKKDRENYLEGFDRIIFVENEEAIKNMFETVPFNKWCKKNGKSYARNYENGLFYRDETIMRGQAFVIERSINQKNLIKPFYNTPQTTMRMSEDAVKQYVEIKRKELGEKEKAKKYQLSTVETDRYIVVNLIVQELHKMAMIENIIEDKNEKREVLVFTTEKQIDFIERCFGKDNIKIAKIGEKELERYLEEKRKQNMR